MTESWLFYFRNESATLNFWIVLYIYIFFRSTNKRKCRSIVKWNCNTNVTIVICWRTHSSENTVPENSSDCAWVFFCDKLHKSCTPTFFIFPQNNIDSAKTFFCDGQKQNPASVVTSVSAATMSTTMAGELVICFAEHKAPHDKRNPNCRNNSRPRKKAPGSGCEVKRSLFIPSLEDWTSSPKSVFLVYFFVVNFCYCASVTKCPVRRVLMWFDASHIFLVFIRSRFAQSVAVAACPDLDEASVFLKNTVWCRWEQNVLSSGVLIQKVRLTRSSSSSSSRVRRVQCQLSGCSTWVDEQFCS